MKYRELLRTAYKDDQTLIKLEKSLRGLQLKQAQKSVPWELITNPTIIEKPIEPVKKQILAIGTLLGLFFTTIAIFYKEIREQFILQKK